MQKSVHWRLWPLYSYFLIFVSLFWGFSRYPDLDKKLAMGEGIKVEGVLTPRVILQTNENFNFIINLLIDALNFIAANVYGMSFGIILAGIAKTYFELRSKTQNNVSNSFFKRIFNGWIIGAPLGLCVNCATPLGMTLQKQKKDPLLAITAMIASPTFNIISLVMVFNLFPFRFFLIKVLATLVLILVIIPVLVRNITIDDHGSVCELDYTSGDPLAWKSLNKTLFKNVIEVCKNVMPAMMLIALLGPLMAMVMSKFPVQEILLNDGFITYLLYAFIGTFLPVPMLFDVVMPFTLHTIGLSSGVTMTLMFTLGAFSIFPLLLIFQKISRKLAISLFLSVSILGLLAGLSERMAAGLSFNSYKNEFNLHSMVSDIDSLCRNENNKEDCKNRAFHYLGVFENVKTYCNQIRNENLKSECLRKYGHGQFDKKIINIKFCERVSNNQMQQICIDELISNNLFKEGFSCTEFKNADHQDYCHYQTAYKRALQSNGLVECLNLKDEHKNICVGNVLSPLSEKGELQNKDCDIIGDEKLKIRCLNHSLASQALKNGSDLTTKFSLCPNRHCKMILANQLFKMGETSNFCSNLPIGDQNNCHDQRIFQTAKSGLENNCKKLKNGNLIQKCDYFFMQGKLNLDIRRIFNKYNRPSSDIRLSQRLTSNQVTLESIKQKSFFSNHEKYKEIEVHTYDPRKENIPGFTSKERVDLTPATVDPFLMLFNPFAYGQSISTGDLNNDDLPDLIIPEGNRINIHINKGDFKFKRYELSLKEHFILYVIPSDLDNDGFEDLVVSTYGGGNYYVLNENMSFKKAVTFPGPAEKITSLAATLADINHDGKPDLYFGNWSRGIETGMIYKLKPAKTSKNHLVMNDHPSYRFEYFEEETPGETLSSLFSDINGDHRPDLLSGNDFEIPDNHFLNHKDGFKPITRYSGNIPKTTTFTMSINSGDINNDLVPDLFMTDMPLFFSITDQDYCEGIKDTPSRKFCQTYMKSSPFISKGSFTDCRHFPEKQRVNCRMAAYLKKLIEMKSKDCNSIPYGFTNYRILCKANLLSKNEKPTPNETKVHASKVDQVSRNMLLIGSKKGQFKDQTKKYGVENSYWSWNSRMADLDNDGFQDIYVGNGYIMDRNVTPNVFYQNQQGRKFKNSSKEFGLDDRLHTPSFVIADFDRDGDLDVVTRPLLSPIKIFQNNGNMNNSISIKLQFKMENKQGIGSKIYITYGEKQKLEQFRELKAGGGFLSFDPIESHFGLGSFKVIDEIRIISPKGIESKFKGPFPANNFYKITL